MPVLLPPVDTFRRATEYKGRSSDQLLKEVDRLIGLFHQSEGRRRLAYCVSIYPLLIQWISQRPAKAKDKHVEQVRTLATLVLEWLQDGNANNFRNDMNALAATVGARPMHHHYDGEDVAFVKVKKDHYLINNHAGASEIGAFKKKVEIARTKGLTGDAFLNEMSEILPRGRKVEVPPGTSIAGRNQLERQVAKENLTLKMEALQTLGARPADIGPTEGGMPIQNTFFIAQLLPQSLGIYMRKEMRRRYVLKFEDPAPGRQVRVFQPYPPPADPTQDRLFDTRDGQDAPNTYIYAVGMKQVGGYHEFCASGLSVIEGAATQHSSFFKGAPVLSAGTIQATAGVITEITNMSGHYKPLGEHVRKAVMELQRRQAVTGQLKVKIMVGDVTVTYSGQSLVAAGFAALPENLEISHQVFAMTPALFQQFLTRHHVVSWHAVMAGTEQLGPLVANWHWGAYRPPAGPRNAPLINRVPGAGGPGGAGGPPAAPGAH